MLTIEQIISEADTQVPNSFSQPQKIAWINEINQEFFEIVKIPKVFIGTINPNTPTMILPTTIRSRNVDYTTIGSSVYKPMQFEDVQPGRSFWYLDDLTNTMTINPVVSSSVYSNVVIRYFQVSTVTFLSTNQTVSPEAPAEYHWIYILGLCARIAKSIPDVTLANNYQQDYERNLAIAQQNYIKKR